MLTTLLTSLVTPDLPGDTETTTAASAINGQVALDADGALNYTAPARGGDAVTDTVTDQLGKSPPAK